MKTPNKKSAIRSQVRVQPIQRHQIEYRSCALDQLLPVDHRARMVWAFVMSLEFDPLYSKIKAFTDGVGRSAIPPELLLGLWLQATLDGIGSARELARRCESDIVYQWYCGKISVNYHTLSDFRSRNPELLEKLLTNMVASMISAGVVPLETIAQDGMRVRASAGKSSFRRKPTLEELQKLAQTHVQQLKQSTENGEVKKEVDARRLAAEERAAREREERLAQALKEHQKLAEQREQRETGQGDQTRTSTTDPEARKMKMPNGGFDPAYNVQFATDAETGVIVGVMVTNEGTDGGQLEPMHRQIHEKYGKTPKQVLVDSAYATKQGVTTLEAAGTEVVSTIPRQAQLKEHGKDPYSRQKGDTPEYVRFRERMAKAEYKQLYKRRAQVAELPNAQCRNRNLRQFTVRGKTKVTAVALLHALAINLLRQFQLKAAAT